jgi:hypothetical protein
MQHTRRVFTLFTGSVGALGLLSGRSLILGARAQTVLSGVFVANGKAATLTQVTAHKGEPVFNKPVTELVFTAMDQKGDPKAAFNAAFHKYGDAIIAKVMADGKVVGTELVHSGWHRPNMVVSTAGTIEIVDFSVTGGEISGRLTTNGMQEFFSDKCEVNLTFKTKAP